MRRQPVRFAFAAVTALLGQSPVALAQTPPKPAPAATPDLVTDAQKSAFLALPLATRVAAQDALVWLGLHNGVADGSFGPRTRDLDRRLAAQRQGDAGRGSWPRASSRR